MQDPDYSGIIFKIEQTIHRKDEEAKAGGLALTDSQVISILTKAIGAAHGKAVKLPESSNPRDQILAKLLLDLKDTRVALFGAAEDEDPTDTMRWIGSLGCAIESAKLRKGPVPGSRDYLDFLGPFLARAEGEEIP